jgi:phosphate transport system substrate-binding protein
MTQHTRHRPLLGAAVLLVASAVGLAVGAAAPVPQSGGDAPQVDAGLPDYQRPATAPGGTVRIAGHATVAGLLDRQGEGFRRVASGTSFDVKGGGADGAIKALVDGTADLVGLTRPLTAAERSQFEAKFRHAPTEITIGYDALSIYVHKDNPIGGLTLPDVAAIFGATPPAGRAQAKTWGDVGGTGEFAKTPLVVFGPAAGVGGSTILREAVLGGGEFRSDLQVQRTSSGIVNGVGGEKGGVGFASQFFRTAATRVVPLARASGQPFVAPTAATVVDGSYPLRRPLVVVVAKAPNAPLPPQVAEFLAFVLSRPGQEIVAREGSFTISAAAAREQLGRVR